MAITAASDTTPTATAASKASTKTAKSAMASRPAKKATPKTGKASTTVPATPASTLKEVAVKSRRKVHRVVHLTRDASIKLIDSQRAIWLAGLGALAKATTKTGAKGEKAFEALIKAGEKLESQARGTIDSNTSLLKVRINDATKAVDNGIDTVGEAFDNRVKQALSRLGYPKNGKTLRQYRAQANKGV
jgi:poly(hydroxyalkanoate) granule-associated protein